MSNQAEQAFSALTAAQAAHPRLAAQRAAFDREFDIDDDSFTSLQPLGDASVMVIYSFDSNTDLTIDGVMLGGEFVEAHCFTGYVLNQWRRDIGAEERKAAEIQSWGE